MKSSFAYRRRSFYNNNKKKQYENSIWACRKVCNTGLTVIILLIYLDFKLPANRTAVLLSDLFGFFLENFPIQHTVQTWNKQRQEIQ